MAEQNKILIKSTTKYLSDVRDFIENVALKFGFDLKEANQIVLSVDEACTNIMKYSHNYNEDKNIEIIAERNNEELIFDIVYEGEEFNPNSIDLPNMIEYFQSYKIGGLGIPLMKKFMSKIEYEHIIPNRNHLKLIKKLKLANP